MRRILSTFVATVCLLALFVSSAACVALPLVQATAQTMDSQMPAHTVSSPDHECCPSRGPAQGPMQGHSSASCCTVHHQPAAAATVNEFDSSFTIAHAGLSAALLPVATVARPSGKKTGPPPRRPAPALRI